MIQHVAFLRAINVGGRNVAMERLRQIFATMGFVDIATFIASGNVLFRAATADREALERQIEHALHEALGFEATTFVRTRSEVAAIAGFRAFSAKQTTAAKALNVGLLKAPLTREQEKRLSTFSGEIDSFHLHQRELYWLCRARQSDSAFSNAVFEKAFKVRATFRSLTTIRKLVDTYSPE